MAEEITLSALNSSQSAIAPGSPIVVTSETAKPAFIGGPTANAVSINGAIYRGVVSYKTAGHIELNDWSLVTGSKHLSVGAYYYLSGIGSLSSTTSNNQLIGQSVSQWSLLLLIGGSSVSAANLATVTGDLNAEIANRIAGDDSEASSRATQDSFLIAAITSESVARSSADSNLQSQINALTYSYAHSMLLGGM